MAIHRVAPFDDFADPGDEDQAEPDRRHREQRVRGRAEQPGLAAGRHPHDRDADQDADELHLEVVVGRLAYDRSATDAVDSTMTRPRLSSSVVIPAIR